MRKIKRVVLHCTSGWPQETTESIRNYWRNNLGWKSPGYHRLISVDGKIESLAALSEVSNGVFGYNSDSVHICYKGGLLRVDTVNGKTKYSYGDTRTEAQKKALIKAIKDVMAELSKTQAVDDVTVVGHRDLSKDLNNNELIEEREWVKICPAFDAIKEYEHLLGEKAKERLKKRSTY